MDPTPVRSSALRLAAVILLVVSSPLAGQTADDSAAVKVIEATRLVGSSVRVDGELTEALWQGASFVSGFIQNDPVEGAPATVRTEVAMVYDDAALYIGARMYHVNPDNIGDQLTRRDNPGNAERILFSFDSYRDRRTAYTFGVTAAGVRFDYYHSSDNERDRDYSFDPVWTAKTRIDSNGWTAELRIPFSQLRYSSADVQIWGVNINRFIPSRNEDIYWVHIPKQETGWSSRMGMLEGISGLPHSRRMELSPYVASNATFVANADPADPFTDGSDFEGRAGADFKMGLGPSLTLDATVNPDFGQVEADPAVVNLSAVETFFPERRPFFTEGAQLLRGGGPNFYYSRRIGARPAAPGTGDYSDSPSAATILGAAKVSGRLSSGTSIGTLVALTDREYARTYEASGDTFGREQVAPLTGFAIARVQQEFGRDVSTVGLTLTGVHRDLTSGTPLASSLMRNAVSVGSDWRLRFNNGMYLLSGSVGLSHIDGSAEAMLEQQLSSRRYFQRPDQDYVTVDPTRTSMTGYQAFLSFNKRSGRHWLYGVGGDAQSPMFEINDAGRMGTTDDINSYAWIEYRETEPGQLFRNYSVELSGNMGWNFGGVRQFARVELEGDVQLKNFWSIGTNIRYFPESQSDRLTRGGPLMSTTRDLFIGASVRNNFSSQTRFGVEADYGVDPQGGFFVGLAASLTVRPSPVLEISLSPSVKQLRDTRQYITEAAGNRPEVYGGRYIFGSIRRSEISASIRANYSFTPDLTLELYAEPFVSSGQYTEIGELRAARTNDLRVYGAEPGTSITPFIDAATGEIQYYDVTDGPDSFSIEYPDFNLRSFRSNLVLRWEWRPGSSLFLVWQQDNGHSGNPLERAKLGSFFNSIGVGGDNFIALKASYWIPIG